MNDKITLPTLIQLLALATGDRKKQSEDFIKEFFGLISSLLSEGEQVKIKDLGVFKTVEVEERKSVNVTTGEDNIIPSHRKVVFIPSKEIAALVNAPFEMFETVELEDEEFEAVPDNGVASNEANVRDEEGEDDAIIYDEAEDSVVEDSEPAVEDTDSGIDIDAVTGYSIEDSTEEAAEPVYTVTDQPEENSETTVQEETPQEEHHEAVYVFEEAPQKVESVVGPQPREPLQTAVTPKITKAPEVVNPQVHAESAPNPAPEVREEPVKNAPTRRSTGKRKNRTNFAGGFLTGFVAAILLLLIAGGILYLFDVKIFNRAISTTETSVEDTTGAIAADTEESLNSAVEVIKSDGADSTEEVAEEETKALEQKDEVPTQPSDKKVYDTISKTRFLTTMAKEHYGNYHLWPYIYMENASFLGHPDRIRPGTKVVIPPLSKYGVDAKNPKDIEKAKKKGVQIYSRYK